MGDTHTVTVNDDRFQIIRHPAEGEEGSSLWLTLKSGVKLDHEDGASIDLTLTVTDAGGLTGTAEVTITVTDINEAPTASGDPLTITGDAGKVLKDAEIDLLAAFSDPDGDTPVRYTASGTPSWLTFSVQFGEDDDGNAAATGIFTGTPPAGTDTSHTVTITATDAGGLEASTSVRIVLDDGNDDITAVNLIDSDGAVTIEAEVDENDASGPVLGEIRVVDQDDPDHPTGMHLIQVLSGITESIAPDAREDGRFEVKYDDEGIPWLAVKESSTFDHEHPTEQGSIDITIRAVDLNGATNTRGTTFTGNIEHQTITVFVGDENDAPTANKIGNWWVTAEDGLQASDADDIAKGQWLTFGLDTTGADAAFTDPEGDKLTYSLSGPAILEINKNSGQITNVKGALPIEGNHKFTVTATDPDGLSTSSDFYVAIALSGDGNDATADDDNDTPDFSNPREFDYAEGAGDGTVVATFTVTDEDNGLGHHPFALDSVRITQLVVDFQDGDTDDETIVIPEDDLSTPANEALPTTGYAGAFRLSEPRKSGNTWTYDLIVKDTNRLPTIDTTDILDHEVVDSVTVTVTATDGVADLDDDTDGVQGVTETIDVDINDVNEAPAVAGVSRTAPAGTLLNAVLAGENELEQSEASKVVLYINLESLWDDPDDNDDADELTFTATTQTPWIKILNGPAQYDDISDKVTWDTPGSGATGRTVGTAPADGNDDTWVVVVEIDRTGQNNGQGDRGSFTLTAKDDRGGPTGTLVVPVTVDDENLPILANANAVTISGSPREDATLRATFDDNKDPDLRGDAKPVLVLYRWFQDDVDSEGTVTAADAPFRVSTDGAYKLTQGDVDHAIRVQVWHYEVLDGQIVRVNSDDDGTGAPIPVQASTPGSRPVSNTPDKGTGSITILASTNALRVDANALSVTDTDIQSTPLDDSDVTISWQVSDNGRGGWAPVPAGAGTATVNGDVTGGTLTLDSDGAGDSAAAAGNGQGKYYRAVASYDSDGDGTGTEMESIYSDPVRVANIRDDARPEAQLPDITGSAFPGGTLTVDAGSATVSVQWQVQRGTNWVDIDGAAGSSLALTQANAGQMIRAVVSYESTTPNSPGVTEIVATAAQSVGGTISGTGALPAGVKDHDIEVNVMDTGHGRDLNTTVEGDQAGHNLMLTETVDLRSLFQDPDSARLTFTVVTPAAYLDENTGVGSQYVFGDATGGVLTLNTVTGELTFNSDVYRGHDDDGTDGMGNVISLTINANDDPDGPGPVVGNNSATDAMVNIRINVAPTGIMFADNPSDSGDAGDGTGAAAIVNEHVGSQQAGARGQVIATLDVLDENSVSHKFGTHDVTLSGDDRFMITKTGNAANGRDGDNNGSTFDVRLKAGAKLDFETQKDMDPMLAGKQIVLTLTATDGGGLSTPAGPGTTPIKLTVTVNDVETGDLNQSTTPTPANVPGLEDVNDGEDDERVDGNDPDTDGGANPSMDAMMMSTLDDGLF